MPKTKANFLILFLLALSSFTVGQVLIKQISQKQNPEKAAHEKGEFLVTKVIDGNTIELKTGERVKYIGISAPSLSGEIECYAREAKWENERLVLKKIVSLEKDISDKDSQGNLLRYVWLYGKMVNLELVKTGFAKAAPFSADRKYHQSFVEAEKHARQNNLGLWLRCEN